MRKTKREEENSYMEEKKKGKKGKWLQFPVFRRAEVDKPRIKVGLLDESYE